MGFLDRLEDDIKRVHLGSKTIEEDCSYVDSSNVEVPIKASIDVDSFNTGAGAEVEFNAGISSLAHIYVAKIWMPALPKQDEVIRQESTGTNWRIQQIKQEHGLYTFVCTANHKVKRGRIR